MNTVTRIAISIGEDLRVTLHPNGGIEIERRQGAVGWILDNDAIMNRDLYMLLAEAREMVNYARRACAD